MKWEHQHYEMLRAGYGKIPSRELAERIGCTEKALRTKAKILKISTGRNVRFLPGEIEGIKALWLTHTADEIGAMLNRPGHSISGFGHRNGLPRKWEHWSAETIEAVRLAHADGLNDAEIARRIGIQRRTVSSIRAERLKLPQNVAAIQAAHQRALQSQRKSLGIRSSAELRWRSFRRFAAQNGWPADLRPRSVQILNVLAERGPLTRQQLAAAIGMNAEIEAKKLLSSNDLEGSYTAHLIARGLIAAVPRHTTGRGKGKNRLRNVYTLTLAAIGMIEARLAAEGKVANG